MAYSIYPLKTNKNIQMKTARQLTLALLITIVIIVLIGGIMLLNDPSGRILQLSEDDVRGSLMKDFKPFAWLLIITAGLTGIIAAVFTYTHRKNFPALIIAEGIILLLWCIIFIVYVTNSILMIIVLGFIGAALILLGRLISKQQKNTAEHHVTTNDNKHTQHSHSGQKSHYHKHRKRGH